MTLILGSGDFRFTPEPDWPKLPADLEMGDVAAVAVDADDRVYLFNRGPNPMIITNTDGEVLDCWGQGVFSNPHGIHIGPDRCIYCTDEGDHSVRKLTPDGKILMTLGTPGKPAAKLCGDPFCRCTHTAHAPNGDLFVSDGYGNARVHKYDANGKHLFSWGTPGTGEGEFNFPHNICCDADGWVYVADRENHRIQVFDSNGSYETQINNLHRPSALTITPGSSPLLIVGEIAPYMDVNRGWPNAGPRVSVLSNDGKLLSRLTIVEDPAGTGPGQFLSPHGIAMDSKGDLYVGEVSSRAWPSLFPGTPVPANLPRMRKLRRVR